MDINNIDYSKYSVPELMQAKSSINPEVAPQNFENLRSELEKRKDEIEAYFEEKRNASLFSSKNPNNENRAKLLGYFQLAGAAVIFILLLLSFAGTLSALSIFISIVAIVLNGTAGYLTVKKSVTGYKLSLFNLSLQLVAISTGSFLYSYNGLGGVFLNIGNGISLNASFSPGFQIVWGAQSLETSFDIDLLAVLFIGVILSLLRKNAEVANK